MTGTDWVQIVAASAFPLAIIAVILNRCHTGKGIGVRIIQFVFSATVVPGVMILAIRGLVGGEASIAVIAALAGYLFASIAKFDERSNSGD